MHQLGHTRSSYQRDHAVITPDTFVRAPLPGMKGATAIVHAAPAMGAAFLQYTAELEVAGALGPVAIQRFVYVLEGELLVEIGRKKHRLKPNGYAFLSAGSRHGITSVVKSRAAVIEKPYQAVKGIRQPEPVIGNERAVAPQFLAGDEALDVRCLLPADPSFDMAVNTMTFQPGATLPMVETHVMEHGLLMLEGGGIYRLGNCWYPVTAGDFIWMGPGCPQWFGALGHSPTRYLIYKDWNR